MALDLPAFERPTNAISATEGRGSSRGSCTDRAKAALARASAVKSRSLPRGFSMRFVPLLPGVIALVYASALSAADAPAKRGLERGRQLATTVCAACHGADGRATAPTNPNLAGQHADYIAAQLAAFKAGARPSPIMVGMAAPLTPEDMQAVGAYYASQKPVESVARDKALVPRGEKLWRAGLKNVSAPACAGCHGAAGHRIPSHHPHLP